MKFGVRIPSLKKRISARTSWKRVVRHSMGLKMPRGYGFITNPKKAIYNKIYNKTSIGLGSLIKSPSKSSLMSQSSIPQSQITPVSYDNPFTFAPQSFIHLINKPAKFGKDGWIVLLIIFSFFCLGNPIFGIPLLIGSFYWFYRITKQSWYIIKINLKKANKYLKANNFEQAIEPLNIIKNLDPDNLEIDYLLGVSLHTVGNNVCSAKHLQKYIKSNENDLDAKLILGYVLYKSGKFKDAISILQQFPQDHPNHLMIITILGDSFLNLKEYDMAIESFKRGPLRKINLDSQLLQLHYLLGQAYKEKGQKVNALKEFKRVYSFDINYKDVSDEINLLESNKNAKS